MNREIEKFEKNEKCENKNWKIIIVQGQIKGHLGKVEVDDQVAGLQHVAENYGIIDLNRIAIEGWSYGGFMSLMSIAKRSDIFKVYFLILFEKKKNWKIFRDDFLKISFRWPLWAHQ